MNDKVVAVTIMGAAIVLHGMLIYMYLTGGAYG